MQTTDKKMFRDMQEHPEKYSDQQIEVMMDDLDQRPDVETAWQRFISEKVKVKSFSLFTLSLFTYRKVAASVIGILLVTGIAFASIHFVQRNGSTPNPARDGGEKAGVVMTNRNDSLPPQGEVEEASIIFENVPLDSMLMEMASYYQVGVEFTREETRQLRFHFVWKRNESLDRVLERLNNFKAVNIEKSDTVIIVE